MDVLIGRVHSGVQRLQQNVHAQLQLLSSTAPPVSAADASWAMQSMFVPNAPPQVRTRVLSTPESPSCSGEDTSGVLTEMDGVSLLIASFLDGESLAHVRAVSRSWREFVNQHREALYSQLLTTPRCEFPSVIASSCAFKSYLFSLRDALDVELQHTLAIEPIATALEDFSAQDRSRHGFVAMFCDLIEFRDPRIARFVAHKRQSALSMVLARTPEDVTAFRRRSHFVGPITFVPIDNPHWPQYEPSPPLDDCPGFLGYAYDHATVVPGYESLKRSVVKSILKELMLFDSQENAAAYGRRIGAAPFAAIVSDDEAGAGGRGYGGCPLVFSSPLRRRMRHLTAGERVQRLEARIEAVDRCILAHMEQ